MGLLWNERKHAKKINHIAAVINNIEETAKSYQNILGITFFDIEVVVHQKRKVEFFKIGESNTELVQPEELDSPLGWKLEEPQNQYLYHCCPNLRPHCNGTGSYKCFDFMVLFQSLKNKSIRQWRKFLSDAARRFCPSQRDGLYKKDT